MNRAPCLLALPAGTALGVSALAGVSPPTAVSSFVAQE